jgi:hypothetical protein
MMSFLLLFLASFAFVIKLDDYLLDMNAVKRIRAAGRKR